MVGECHRDETRQAKTKYDIYWLMEHGLYTVIQQSSTATITMLVGMKVVTGTRNGHTLITQRARRHCMLRVVPKSNGHNTNAIQQATVPYPPTPTMARSPRSIEMNATPGHFTSTVQPQNGIVNEMNTVCRQRRSQARRTAGACSQPRKRGVR